MELVRLVDCPQFWEWYLGGRFKCHRGTGRMIRTAFSKHIKLTLAQVFYTEVHLQPFHFVPLFETFQGDGPKPFKTHYP